MLLLKIVLYLSNIFQPPPRYEGRFKHYLSVIFHNFLADPGRFNKASYIADY